jgi:hypothetical protein
MLCSLTSPAIASETWQGGGQIVSGPGRGGTVRLALIKDGNTVRFQSGPDQGKSVSLNNAQTSSGKWQFDDCGDYSDKLCVTFEQNKPRRVIRYLLTKS